MEAAELVQCDLNEPGITQRRYGRGFSYLAPDGEKITDADDAGRTQYIYHPQWRAQQDERKFNRVLDVGDSLPAARRRVTRLLRKEDEHREKALAIAFRLLDLAALRVGNEEYALQNGSYGLTTMLVKHVQCDGSTVRLCFPAKSGQTVETEITNKTLVTALQPLLQRPRTRPALAWKQGVTGTR